MSIRLAFQKVGGMVFQFARVDREGKEPADELKGIICSKFCLLITVVLAVHIKQKGNAACMSTKNDFEIELLCMFVSFISCKLCEESG